MKSFFQSLVIVVCANVAIPFSGFVSSALAAPQAYLTMPISVAVISGVDKSEFESKVHPILKQEMKSCSICSFQNVTPYDSEGRLNLKELAARIESVGTSASFIVLDWNARVTDETRPILETLKKLIGSGYIVVGSAGLAKDSEPTLPLNRTVLGQAKGAIIIGELAERERLLTQSYFGPEMLTALRPPRDYLGQGVAPLFFASKLATQWNKKTSQEWVASFHSTKSKVRRIWPGLEDFF
jgi:hypothetical protein